MKALQLALLSVSPPGQLSIFDVAPALAKPAPVAHVAPEVPRSLYLRDRCKLDVYDFLAGQPDYTATIADVYAFACNDHSAAIAFDAMAELEEYEIVAPRDLPGLGACLALVRAPRGAR